MLIPNAHYSIILHEVGHALGLGHLESTRQTVMYPYDQGLTFLKNIDIRNIRKLYGRNLLPKRAERSHSSDHDAIDGVSNHAVTCVAEITGENTTFTNLPTRGENKKLLEYLQAYRR